MSSPESPELIGRRYLIVNRIGQGGMGTVYRAIDRLTGRVVTLKQVVGELESVRDSGGRYQDARLALAREFQVLAGIRHPNIISVLDYGFDSAGQPFFTMDLAEAALPFVEAGRAQPLSVQIDLLVQVLQALHYLHQRGILHRDVKPSNVLVVAGQVKVLDFGIALRREEAQPSDNVEGTLAYLAPELLSGAAPSRAGDLYAVGVMAYELFLGKHPFDVSSFGKLVSAVMTVTPDLSSTEIDPRLREILRRLLAKQPKERFDGDASAVIAALGRALGRELAKETAQIRESFLQSAPLVGREAELGLLERALGALAVEGEGAAIGLRGESGVGKSRLLAELRTRAMVAGATVLSGQAVSEGGTPYLILREPLRSLALSTEMSDTEASVVRALVPDLGAVLGRPVGPAPALDPGPAQARLLDVLEELFRRQQAPTLLLLEDVHWAGPEVLAVVRRLAALARSAPLLIVVTWRADEAPGLVQELAELRAVELQRLSPAAITRLCAFMLGPAGERPEVVDLLQRETEGNAFFVVEAVRALLEEGGANVGGPLPARRVSGGVRRLASRRTERIQAPDRPLLQLAALIGRQLDLRLLGTLAPDQELDPWLARCSEAAVLEHFDGIWRFSHDKLREYIVDELGRQPEVLTQLHARVARAIEATWPGSTEQAATLAWHWGQAGEVHEELRWSAIAGEQALDVSAYQAACTLLERALDLGERLGAPIASRIRWRRRLAEARYVLGEGEAAAAHLSAGMALGGQAPPTGRAGLALLMVQQLAVQITHMIVPVRRSLPPDAREVQVELSRSAGRLTLISIMSDDQLGVLTYALMAVNLADRAQATVSYALGVLAYATQSMRLVSTSTRYFQRARDGAKDDAFVTVELALLEVSGMLGVGRISEARSFIASTLEVATRIRHEGGRGYLLAIDGLCSWYEARLDDVDAVIGALDAVGRDSSYAAGLAPWIAIWLSLQGRGEEGLAILDELRAAIPAGQDTVVRVVAATQALVLTRLGRLPEALAHTDAVLSRVGSPGSIPPVNQWVFTGLCETLLAAVEAAPAGATRRQAERRARVALTAYRRWSWIYPVGRPELARFEGDLARLGAQPARARRAYERSVLRSRELGQRLHEALAELALGRLEIVAPADRRAHLERASALLNGSAMPFHAVAVADALDRS